MYRLAVSLLFCDSRQWLLKSSFLLSSIVCTQPAPVIQRKILKCQQLIITSQTDYPALFVCISCLSGLYVSTERITSWSCFFFFFLITSGIARVCAIELLYKLVSDRKGSKVCIFAVNFSIAVEYCPVFLNHGFQDYRVPSEAFVQFMVQIHGSGTVDSP